MSARLGRSRSERSSSREDRFARVRSTARRQSGEARHLDAVGAVGGAGHDLVQEDHLAVPLGDLQGRVGEARQALGERGQLVEMRREQRPAAVRPRAGARSPPRRSRGRRRSRCRGRSRRGSRASARVAWFRIAAVSTISTMKVERPRARSSAAPTRENSRSTTPICAAVAGTKEPICASTAISAFWRR